MDSYSHSIQYRGLIQNNQVRDPRRIKKWGLVVLLIGFLFSYALVYVWTRIKITNLRYAYTNLQAEEVRVINEERKLTIEWATLTSLSQIEKMAKEKLGMAVPEKEHVSILYESPDLKQ